MGRVAHFYRSNNENMIGRVAYLVTILADPQLSYRTAARQLWMNTFPTVNTDSRVVRHFFANFAFAFLLGYHFLVNIVFKAFRVGREAFQETRFTVSEIPF